MIKVLYDVSKYRLWIRFLAVLVFIGLSVLSFDGLECLRSSCYSRWRIHFFSPPRELLYKLYSTNPAFRCSSEGFFKFRDFIANKISVRITNVATMLKSVTAVPTPCGVSVV